MASDQPADRGDVDVLGFEIVPGVKVVLGEETAPYYSDRNPLVHS
jgi:hypothetical protein